MVYYKKKGQFKIAKSNKNQEKKNQVSLVFAEHDIWQV